MEQIDEEIKKIYFTVQEVAQQLGVTVNTVNWYIRAYKIPLKTVGVGRRRRFTEKNVDTLRILMTARQQLSAKGIGRKLAKRLLTAA